MLSLSALPIPAHPCAQLPFLEAGDIIIDGGNSNYDDSIRRAKDLGEKGFLFVGSGVSGGEEVRQLRHRF